MRTLLVLTVLVVGCASPTPYQKMGYAGGYADTQLSERVFEISFAGNGYTHRMTVEAYTMRRAAEVTVARGFAGFVEVGQEGHTDQSLAYYNNNPYIVARHSGTKRIYLLTAEEMEEAPAAVDARMILRRWPTEAQRQAAEEAARGREIELERCRQTLAGPDATEFPGYAASCREKLATAGQSATAAAPAR
jgi:hypothetical protein